MSYNSVCVITNFRCASTSFTLLKSEEYDLPYKGELFSHERPYRIGDVPAKWELEEFTYKERDEITKDVNLLREIQKGEPCCFKLMPRHIKNEALREELIQSVDKIYYLYRRDFRAQMKSWIASRMKGDWDQTGFKVVTDRHRDHIQRQKEIHLGRLGKKEKVKRHIKIQPIPTLETLSLEIKRNYTKMSELYKKFPGELVCMEDYFSGDKYNPYNVETILENEIDIPHLDVESLFVDSE